LKNKIKSSISEKNLALLRKGGTALVSFPRSGSTLTRDIFSVMVRRRLKAKYPDIAVDAPEMNPKLIVANLSVPVEVWPQRLGRHPILMRTHQRGPIAEFRTVFLFRNPVDAIHSYIVMEQARAPIPDMDAFLAAIILRWQNLARAALLKVESDRSNIFLVRYEDFLTAPEATFVSIARFIRFDARIPEVRKAVKTVNGRFAKSKAFAPTANQPDRGSQGAGAKRLDPVITARIEAALGAGLDALCAAAREQAAT
jgi:hypothetical protein